MKRVVGIGGSLMIRYVDVSCIHVSVCFCVWLVLVAECVAVCVHLGVDDRCHLPLCSQKEKLNPSGYKTQACQASLVARAWTVITGGSCPPSHRPRWLPCAAGWTSTPARPEDDRRHLSEMSGISLGASIHRSVSSIRVTAGPVCPGPL